jgi:hypothetical protein
MRRDPAMIAYAVAALIMVAIVVLELIFLPRCC